MNHNAGSVILLICFPSKNLSYCACFLFGNAFVSSDVDVVFCPKPSQEPVGFLSKQSRLFSPNKRFDSSVGFSFGFEQV